MTKWSVINSESLLSQRYLYSLAAVSCKHFVQHLP